MKLINQSFFSGGDRNIPNNTTSEAENLDIFIDAYTIDFLRKVVGMRYATDIVKAYTTGTVPEEMAELINGVESYVGEDGSDYSYSGIKEALADYVYYFWQESKITTTTGIGTSIVKTEAGVMASPQDKMIKIWNRMSAGVNSITLFLWQRTSIYPKVEIKQIYEARRSLRRNNTFGL